ncbi:MAG: hypothetical protein ACK46X_07530 [Candidatus Sericytochromatia bacterium]
MAEPRSKKPTAPTPDKPKELTPEEAKQKLADTQGALSAQVAKLKKQFTYNQKLAQDRLDFAVKELATIEGIQKKLAAFRQHLAGSHHFNNMSLLARVYEAVKEMMTIELAAHQHNLEVLESESPLEEKPAFRVPVEDAEYLEARCKLDLALVLFHWIQNAEGIDVIMRATVNEMAIDCRDLEEEDMRHQRAYEMQSTLMRDREWAKTLGQIGLELQETRALIEWAQSNLKSIASLPAQARKHAVSDADWAKLNAKVLFLGDIFQRMQAFPALAKHFPKPEPTPLPYEQVAWTDSNTGPIQRGTKPAGPAARYAWLLLVIVTGMMTVTGCTGLIALP